MSFVIYNMATFITSLTESELKTHIKDSLREILAEQTTFNNVNVTPQYPARMDINKAAEYLNLSVQTIYSKTSSRTLPHIKKGKRLYFERASLDAWLLEGKKQTVNELITDTNAYIANGSKSKRKR